MSVIDKTGESILREILDRVKRIEIHIGAARAPAAAASVAAPAAIPMGAIAPDSELDAANGYGDPVVRKDPPRWKGQSYVGLKFSETEPDFLEVVASFREFCAANPRPGAEPKYREYDLRDAARARGWAERLRTRATEHVADSHGTAEIDDMGEIPF